MTKNKNAHNSAVVQQINGRDGEPATLLSRRLLNFSWRVIGFALRHFNRFRFDVDSKFQELNLQGE